VVTALALAISASAMAAVEIRLRDGSRWRGELDQDVVLQIMERGVEMPFSGKLVKVSDLYIVVEGEVLGEIKPKTIFRTDIITMKNRDAGGSDTAAQPANGASSTSTTSSSSRKNPDINPSAPGVIVFPLDGGVGQEIRREEFELVKKEADRLGDGQVIVLLINTNGGSAAETEHIAHVIFDMKERHRVVAWIKKAISAGCMIAMCCDEVYFQTTGSAGAVTTWNPGSGQSIKGEELQRSMDHFGRVAERAGRHRYIAYAMKTNAAKLSYDKDPETGKVTWHNDLSGEFILSDGDKRNNLSFTASVAEHCGFSDGTADTQDELAKLLDLPKWNEVTDYGRKISKAWQDLCAEASEDIPKTIARMGYKNAGEDAETQIGTQIRLREELVTWWERCKNVAQTMLPPKEVIEREIEELRKQLADIKRARR
jgi:ATP-dependent protease ClpP protease subunit